MNINQKVLIPTLIRIIIQLVSKKETACFCDKKIQECSRWTLQVEGRGSEEVLRDNKVPH